MPAPERLLFVRPIAGSTYTEVAASLSLSSWTQPDDRTAGASFPTTLENPARRGHVETGGGQSPDEPFVFDLDHYVDWLNFVSGVASYDGEADPFGGTFTAGGLRASHSGGMVSGTYPGPEGDDDPIYYVDGHSAAWAPTLTTIAVNHTQAEWQDAWRPAWPDGAIGYEVEQYELDDGTWAAQSEPVSATVTFTLRDASTADLHWAGAATLIALNSRFGSATMTEDGVTLGTRPDADRTNASDVAFGSAIAAVGSPTTNPDVPVELTVTDFTAAPDRSGLFAMWRSVDVEGELVGPAPESWPNTGLINVVSSVVGLTITYAIRPPRIRWIFGESTPPHRRIHPRDDTLASGAGRTWPRSKAYQSGIRTSGGYL